MPDRKVTVCQDVALGVGFRLHELRKKYKDQPNRTVEAQFEIIREIGRIQDRLETDASRHNGDPLFAGQRTRTINLDKLNKFFTR